MAKVSSNDAIHASHCCVWHGCKYGDPDCPVETGRIKQEYICEWCSELLRDEKYLRQQLQVIDKIKAFEKARKEGRQ
jgi:hypothetical protein